MGGAGRGHESGGAHGDEPACAGGGAGGPQDQVGARGNSGDAAGQVGSDPVLVLAEADGDEQRKGFHGALGPCPGRGAGDGRIAAGHEQAALNQTLRQGGAQGGDVVGCGSSGQKAEGGRSGHGMIVPRLERTG